MSFFKPNYLTSCAFCHLFSLSTIDSHPGGSCPRRRLMRGRVLVFELRRVSETKRGSISKRTTLLLIRLAPRATCPYPLCPCGTFPPDRGNLPLTGKALAGAARKEPGRDVVPPGFFFRFYASGASLDSSLISTLSSALLSQQQGFSASPSGLSQQQQSSASSAGLSHQHSPSAGASQAHSCARSCAIWS